MDFASPQGFEDELRRLEHESQRRRSAIAELSKTKENLSKMIQQREDDLRQLHAQRDATDARRSILSMETLQLSRAVDLCSQEMGRTNGVVDPHGGGVLQRLARSITAQSRERERHRAMLDSILSLGVLPREAE